MKPISLQMYSLRQEAGNDLAGTLKAVAKIGYKAVESGAYDLDPSEFRRMVEAPNRKIHSLGSSHAGITLIRQNGLGLPFWCAFENQHQKRRSALSTKAALGLT